MLFMEALQKIKRGQFPPVLLFYGLETFFIQHLKDALVKSVLGTQNVTDSLSIYDLEETPLDEVITDVETFPFFSEKKLIIAHNPTFLLTKQPKLPVTHDLDRLETYVQHPVDYSVLLLIAPYEKLDQRKKILKLMQQHALVVECHEIKEQEFAKWVTELTTALQVTIEPEVIDLLASELGLNLQLVENELHKCALYVGEGGVITKEIAQELLSHTDTSSAIRLVDAVIEQNLQKAITIYHELAKRQEEPVALIALLAYQYRIMYRVKLLKQKGYTQYQMREQLKVHPYVIKMALEREKNFSEATLKSIIDALAETDARIKMGHMDKHIAFELLLYTLIETVKSAQFT